MKKLFLIIISILIFSSCSINKYQVYETSSDSVNIENDSFLFKNDDLTLKYDLWSKGGNLKITIINNSNQNININLDKSFFILNKYAYDYFKNREYKTEQLTNNSINYDYISHKYIVTNNITIGTTNGVTFKEKSVMSIPANSIKVIEEYKISNQIIECCEKRITDTKKIDVFGEYTKENSPIVFENIISYSKENGNSQIVRNTFWVSKITNYDKRKFLGITYTDNCNNQTSIPKTIILFDVKPNMFYNFFGEN